MLQAITKGTLGKAMEGVSSMGLKLYMENNSETRRFLSDIKDSVIVDHFDKQYLLKFNKTTRLRILFEVYLLPNNIEASLGLSEFIGKFF